MLKQSATARLEIIEGPDIGMIFAFTGEVLLGRSIHNNIPLSDASVSRQHARILQRDKGFAIEDLDSKNGTMLRRKRLISHTPQPLHDGDEIQIGCFFLIFRMDKGNFLRKIMSQS